MSISHPYSICDVLVKDVTSPVAGCDLTRATCDGAGGCGDGPLSLGFGFLQILISDWQVELVGYVWVGFLPIFYSIFTIDLPKK